MHRRTLGKLLAGGGLALGSPKLARSQGTPIKIGLLTDYSGIYKDNNGPGEEYAVQMAIQDSGGGKVLGRKVDLLVADHLNRPDVAASIVKDWLDNEKIDMLMPSGVSVAALAAFVAAREKGVIANVTSPSAVNFTEGDCSPFGFHWTVDSYGYPRSAVLASGDYARKKWFVIATDNITGATSTAACTATIQEAGGQVVGVAKFPLNNTDFGSFILQAQTSQADVVALLCSGTDLVILIKQAREFGLQAGGQFVVVPTLTFPDIGAVGLEAAQGLLFADGFYWNVNDATRGFARRWAEKMKRAPGATNGNAYAAVIHYLQAVEATQTTDGAPVAQAMKSRPITTGFWQNASIRPNGRVVYDLNVLKVKTPAETTGPFDFASVVGTLPGSKVFKPLSTTACKYT